MKTDFILELVKTISWPIVVLIVLFAFYRPLKSLLNRISHIQIGNVALKAIRANAIDAMKYDDFDTNITKDVDDMLFPGF